MCTIKSSVYGAISMLYQGMEAEENKKYGERYGIVLSIMRKLICFYYLHVRRCFFSICNFINL